MSSTQEGTTLILASVAVCLLIYVMNQEYHRDSGSPTIVARLGSVREKVRDAFNRSLVKISPKPALGKRRPQRRKNLDCANVNPNDPDFARCAQDSVGASVGRVRTNNPGHVVSNPTLQFASDSIENQGLGTRLQDEFVNDQYDNSLGKSMGGSKVDFSNLNNNAFFSQGTENPTHAITSGISKAAAEAFPFSSSSVSDPESTVSRSSANAPGTEAVGMGMNFKDFASGNRNGEGKHNQGPQRQQVNQKLGVAPFEEEGKDFNPFVGARPMGKREREHKTKLGMGLDISEAFTQKTLGSGLSIAEAYGSLGAAVAPSSDLGVSAQEIAAATSELEDVNVVQSTIGGQLDFALRP